jgi:hypothetical protein
VDWCEDNLHKQDAFPGILSAIVLSACMGNQDAGAFLKLRELGKSPREQISKNVAWDLIFIQSASMHSIFGSNAETVFCTADRRLAYLAKEFMPGMKSWYLEAMRIAHTGAHRVSPTVFKINKLTESALSNKRISEDLMRLEAVMASASKEFVMIDPVSRLAVNYSDLQTGRTK